MGMSDVDIDMRNAYEKYQYLKDVSISDAMSRLLDHKYDRELIESWLGDHPLANTSIRVWARHTDLPGDPLHERREFRIILDDNGKETCFLLRLHADGKIESEPYSGADYGYTDMDQDDDEHYSEGDY